ncbi:MAG TPA: glycosyltransferase family 2 protein [Candidatus Binatia bacterium]|nr:glycosyltransferase family 2 protein [Candidatus Binatia bacterium]
MKAVSMVMQAKAEPVVTVVTPVYNGAKYLAQCIESVLAQTYQNWEYLIVNNCSTDDSLEVAQRYVQQDGRIRVSNNDSFVTMPENHNIAFRQICPDSKYCKVLHADDWLFPECLTQMVRLAEANPTVGIVGAYGLCDDKVRWDGLSYCETVVSGREICRRTLRGGFYVFGSPTSLLIRSDLIRTQGACYSDEKFLTQYADQDACYRLLRHCDFGFVHQVLTYSRDHEASLTSALTRLNAALPAQLIVLLKYGPIYLEPREYETRLEEITQRYYRFLAQSVFFRHGDKAFWNYHREALRHLNRPLSLAQLGKSAFSEIMDTVCNPFRMAGKVLGLRS